MALGADSGMIMWMVVHQSLIRITLGLLIGLGAALALTRLMTGILYETVPSDLMTYVIVLAVLALAAVSATLVPSIRATRIDPKTAILTE